MEGVIHQFLDSQRIVKDITLKEIEKSQSLHSQSEKEEKEEEAPHTPTILELKEKEQKRELASLTPIIADVIIPGLLELPPQDVTQIYWYC